MGYDGFPPKREGGGYWGIGLVELVWKVYAAVVKCLIKPRMILHDTLHGFRLGRGTGKVTL